MMTRPLILLLVSLLCAVPLTRAAELQLLLLESECKLLGFTGTSTCTDCDTLGSMVPDEELLADCKRCCIADEVKQFTSAVLEVCPYRIGSLPQIKEFVDKYSASFKKQLSVKYEQGRQPQLRLKGGGSASEVIRIDNWKAATIVEFLTGKLMKNDTAAA